MNVSKPSEKSSTAKHKISRRVALIGAAGLAGALGLFVATSPRRYIEEMLHRLLPGHRFDPAGVALFQEELFTVRFTKAQYRLQFYALATAGSMSGFMPAAFRARKEQFERYALTLFMLGSGYFYLRDPKSEVLTYAGAPTQCVSPFAVFDR